MTTQEPTAFRRTVVVVDGPSGSGKSTVSRSVAERLGFEFLDTGAAYRSLAWLGTVRGTDLDDADAVTALLPEFVAGYAIALRPGERWVRVGDHDVTTAIRATAISAAVSKVARVQAVRDAVNALFRRLLADGAAPGVVAEGRDLTTVVAPDATVRILMTADESVRIARRSAEKAGEDAARVAATVTERDAADSKVVDFLHAADGVHVLDSTHLDLPQTVQAMMDLITAAVPEEAP
ncbi:(d)CMP kinase [Pseudoclavibacter chungangensis]|uniref:Cytidylate kinase n=1 Tax=Pseudoclavibacter chungangensis TaxID=587635 RepID=A0A7J5BN24_9MICO|nr:(d)CMP kinase [Pseudoclavibacter chungangensis]KAB1653273.1 (d)CMP kinase [Pseudoclavibacter chungangensis]NYJ66960.1 cytidylate kinase [Pseudoclavibacter chungangensis]